MSDSYISRLISTFETRSDSTAMRIVGYENEVYTFAESLSAIRSVAYRMGQEGVQKGDRVALIGENHPCWALAYLGTLYRGAVCVPIDPNGEIETTTNFLENSEARLAFLAADIVPKFRSIEERLGRHIPAVVWNHESSDNGFQSFADWSTYEFPADFAREVPDIGPDDIALLIYTSGTTGNPKGVPLTHGNIIAELVGIDEVLRLSEKEKILSLLPLFHAYLQIVNLWVATTVGCEVGYLKELSPAELGNAMKEFKPTILTTVPRLWYLFHKKIFDTVNARPWTVRALFRIMLAANCAARDRLGINLGPRLFGKVHESFGGQLRLAVSGGSRFDESVARDFHGLGFTILQGYGLTETSGAATATFEDDNRVGSVGKPMLGTEIKIDQPDNEGVGEVLIRGKVVFQGYYRNDEANDEAFTEDGWFRSGDLGRIDKDGHLYIVGRAKDVIVLPSGKNVHPEDIEVHYLRSPLVEELAIIGIRDDSEQRAGAEKLAAVIVPDFEYLKLAHVSNSREAIRFEFDNLGRELPEYQRVRDYIFRVDPLPRTATRKIKRFELKKAFESGKISGEAPAARSWTFSDEDTRFLDSTVSTAVVAAVRQNAKDAGTIHPDMNLEIDLGLDSLARAETFAALEDAFSTAFGNEEAVKALTIRDVVMLIEKQIGDTRSLAPVQTDLNWSRIVRQNGEAFPEVSVVLKERPFFSAFAFAVYKTFNIFFRIFTRLEVHGSEGFRKMKRPFLICPNHQSFLDPFVLCSTYPFEFFRNTFHVGASEFFENRFMRFVARMLNVVPVDPDTQLMKAMRAGAIGLKNNRILNIYPEGERAFDGELHEFKKGAAILATELDLPIVPVAIDGLHKVWARRSMKIRPGKVKIMIGEPFYPRDVIDATGDPADDHGGRSRDKDYRLVTAHLKKTVAGMIKELRGESGGPGRSA
ncbi:MAG TPA: AMP-binding protein [Pyrinomonadaceae bacterium]|nr:AMP-binding protein [Pyrinomonadaceae bacterium]